MTMASFNIVRVLSYVFVSSRDSCRRSRRSYHVWSCGIRILQVECSGIKEWEYIDNPTDFLGQPAYSEVEKSVVFVHGK